MSLITFINHGILPFTGREGIAARITEAVDRIAEAPGLHAMLMTGEAGAGKSRLIEEAIRRAEESGVAVIHAKLYPESPTAIAPMLSNAIWRYTMSHPAINVSTDDTLPSVASALRRLARLRRLLLVLEDIHLITGEGVPQLGLLLQGLSDEQMVLLCASRPVEIPVRGVLEPYLVDELPLPPLDRDNIRELWIQLFDDPPSDTVIEVVMAATAGNPLAIRSGLRGALNAGTIARDARAGVWRVSNIGTTLKSVLERGVGSLTEGMAAHLQPEERRAASSIAALGEVVARESAAAMIGGDPRTIDILMFKGILTQLDSLIPHLSGNASASPLLAFTHSLLHRRLADDQQADMVKLVEVIAAGLPLFSATPFQTIAAATELPQLPVSVARDAIQRGLDIALELDQTADWPLAMQVWDGAQQLFQHIREQMEPDQRQTLNALLLIRRGNLLHRDHNALKVVLDELLELTATPASDQMWFYRFSALVNQHLQHYHRTGTPHFEARAGIEALVKERPQLQFTQSYVAYLWQRLYIGSLEHDYPTQRAVEAMMNDLMESEQANDEFRGMLRNSLYPILIDLFETEAELEARLRMLQELEQMPHNTHYPDVLHCKLVLLFTIGRMHDVAATAQETIHVARERGLLQNLYFALRCHATAQGMAHLPMERLAADAAQIASTFAEPHTQLQRDHFAYQLSLAATVRGEFGWAERFEQEYMSDWKKFTPLHRRVVHAIQHGDGLPELLQEEIPETPQNGLLHRLITMVVQQNAANAAVLAEEIRTSLSEPILTLPSLVTNRALVALILHAQQFAPLHPLTDLLAQDLPNAIAADLAWCQQQNLPLAMAGALKQFESVMPKREATRWRGVLQGMMRDAAQHQQEPEQQQLALKMIGTIEVHPPNSEAVKPRGERLRVFLGLLTLDAMVEKRLTQRELYRLAVPDMSDPDDIRKSVNLTVYRLRELMGHQAILTDGDTPRLNRAAIQVDILDAYDHLQRATRALSEGGFARAQEALLKGIAITGGEVIFPTLFEEFFQAARQDYENRVCSLTIRTARSLIREGDSIRAEELLAHAVTAMPSNHELRELLHETLRKLGRSIEAERVRMDAGK
ncbi:MAG: AAA family ATPase [Armatimonadetes bacterium]|nr:AAA family ATPase [Armatimonadota bacterium]